MSSKTVLVTGANRGIGYSIVQALATHFPSYTYILTARSYDNATVAIMQLREIGVQAKIEPLALDITNDMSIAAAVKAVKESFGSLNSKTINPASQHAIPTNLNKSSSTMPASPAIPATIQPRTGRATLSPSIRMSPPSHMSPWPFSLY